MSKLYEKYLSLKKENPSTFYLFKNGIFYIFLDEDAKKMSNILNLKLSNLNESVLKCGFPVNSFSKYMNLLDNYNVYIVENNTIQNNSISSDYEKSTLNDLLLKLACVDVDNLSIKDVYLFLEDVSKRANMLINKSKKEE